MRVVYYTELDPLRDQGIYYKIIGQSKTWIGFGHQVELIIVSQKPFDKVDLPEYCSNISTIPNFLPVNFIFTYLNKILSGFKISLSNRNNSYDLLYFRQGIWHPGYTSIMKLARYCVMEVNTIDRNELKFSSILKRKIYFWGKRKILNSISGIISVTNEIGKEYKDERFPIKTVSNGYSFNLDRTFSKEKLRQNNPQLIFISSNLPWHGLDKVIFLANRLTHFHFHIVGPTICQTYTNSNIAFHGILNSRQLDQLYQKMNVGIGSLSLHKYGLTEACPLKTREYLAYGLPVILGYQDVDLLETDEFVLNIGNYPDNVLENIDRIEEFVLLMKDYKLPNSIRDRIDYINKEKERLEFFSRLVGV